MSPGDDRLCGLPYDAPSQGVTAPLKYRESHRSHKMRHQKATIRRRRPPRPRFRCGPAALLDLGCDERAEPIPPIPHSFAADIYVAFVQKTFNIAQQKRVSDIKHDRERYDPGLLVKYLKGSVFHPGRAGGRSTCFNPSCSASVRLTCAAHSAQVV